MSYDILVVEDSKTQAFRLQLLLEDQDWSVEICTSGKDAIESISVKPPRLIILDYRLPDMYGLQLCRQIRTSTALRSLPVLILTEERAEEAILEGLESGADAFIAKNVAEDEFIARVRALLNTASKINSQRQLSETELRRWRVLVIDDSPSYCEFIRSELDSAGFDTKVSYEPAEGLSLLDNHPFDLALIDLTLPEMDGIEVVSRIKADPRFSSMALALLTGKEKDEVVAKGLDAGADDFMFKSHSAKIIIKRCQALVRRRELLSENENLNATIVEKELQKKLAENDAKAARQISEFKSNFLSRMSHEIRTPMNSVIGMCSLLETTDLSDEQRDFLHAIKTAGETLISIINDVLDLSKLQAGKMNLVPQPFDLLKTVSDVVEMFSEAAISRSLNLNSYVSGNTPRLSGDHLRVRQIFINFVGNALKFTEHGSVTITAETKNVDQGVAEILCEVTDTGVGIPEEDQSKVFEAFQQSKSGEKSKIAGTGLGLAICVNLVQAMGGEIGLRSELGKGSTFWFTLRLKTTEEQSSAEDSISTLKGKTCLLISADRSLQNTICDQLETWGIETKLTIDIDAARKELGAPSRGEHFDLVIMDYQIGGKDVTRLAEEIKENADWAKLPLMMVAPAAVQFRRGLEEEARKYGFQRVLPRPVVLTRLRSRIMTCLSAPESTLGAAGVGDADDAKNRAVANRAEAEDSDHKRTREILLVDDDPANRKLGKLLIEKSGHNATLANDGAAALERLAEQRFDIVFMDCQMPGIDGFEATVRFRQTESNSGSERTPIVALTAGVLDGYEKTCFEAGMDDFMAKPVTVKNFHDILEKWLGDSNSDAA